jgi:hypothetical protein
MSALAITAPLAAAAPCATRASHMYSMFQAKELKREKATKVSVPMRMTGSLPN